MAMKSPMRRVPRLTAAALGVVAALSALTCHENTNFHLLEQGSASLAAASPPPVLDFDGLGSIDVGAHATMARQDLRATNLRRLRPYGVSLSVVQPATGQDLTFLRRVHVTVAAPGHDPVTVATGEAFATGTNGVGLEVQDAELLAQARTNGLQVQLVIDDAVAPPQPVALQLSVTLAVEVAQPQGACG